MIAEIDRKMSLQMDKILHDEKFQHLEARWKGLHTLVSQTDFTQNINIEISLIKFHVLN